MADAMIALLRRKLALGPNERDMVVLQHEMEIEYPEDNQRREKHYSTLIAYGEPGGFTAMSRTVGLPAALATKLILTDALPLTGSHIPTHPAIYNPILAELEAGGLRFVEQTEALPPGG
jgi:saccharopine dehydrogenase-like NADP-dependent oxidoreductase